MKTTERYCCPHCGTVHVKDLATRLLSSNPDEGIRGVYHLDTVARMETIHCRTCHHPIEYKRVVKGDFDYHEWALTGGMTTGLIGLVGLRWLAGFGWTPSILLALLAGALVGLILGKLERRRIRARTE